MKFSRPQWLIVILLCATLAMGCTAPAAPAPTATSIPPTDVPTEVPPTATPTATAVPPTPTSTATATPLPPTQTPTAKPTQPPTATPTRTRAPRPTETRAPRPTSAKAPPTAPSGSGGAASITVKNTFPVSCLIIFWGPADLKLDASANGTTSGLIKPGTYGWRAFIGGGETGEAGNLEIPAGGTCTFLCDKDALAIRYGCH